MKEVFDNNLIKIRTRLKKIDGFNYYQRECGQPCLGQNIESLIFDMMKASAEHQKEKADKLLKALECTCGKCKVCEAVELYIKNEIDE